jgi:hypothetical protein
MVRLIAIVFLFSCFIQCTPEKKKEKKKTSDNVVKAYYSNGNLRAAIPQKDKKKHGQATEYFESGKIYQQIDYKEGIKEGMAKRYYENGKLAQETSYMNNQMHGVQRKFREDGKLASEGSFDSGEPCTGLTEYLLDGSKKKKYPSIIVTPLDRVSTEGSYKLIITLSEKVKEVEYFTGQLSDGKCLGSQASKIWNTDRTGTAEINYTVLPGSFIMEKVNIIAKIRTTQGNTYLTQRLVNVAAENRY